MILVFEGIDGSGKSTISNELQKKGYNLIHCPYNPSLPNIFEYYKSLLLEISRPTILNRSFISEVVYGNILRNASRLTNDDFLDLIKIYAQAQGKVIYFFAEEQIIHSRLSSQPSDHHTILQNLRKLITYYDQVANQVSLYIPLIRVDTGKSSVPETLEYLKTKKII